MLSNKMISRFGSGALTCAFASLVGVTAAHADPVPYPGMNGPLAANPKPAEFDAGPLGKVNVTGVLSGIAQTENHPFPGEEKSVLDLTNGQVFIQKTSGIFQFFVQAGVYSLPDLGAAYVKSRTMTSNLYGPLPQAFIKIQPNSDFSIMAGKLPTLIGAESTFTFENMNVERGLLWNQEPAVSRGVQANFSHGPLAFSISMNDGYYSKKFSWLSASLAYTINKQDTLTLAGGGNLSHESRTSFATPLTLNNSDIYNVIFTHTAGPWTIQPYVQFSHIHLAPELGIAHGASTYAAALLAKYSFNPAFSLAGRVEYITTTGDLSNGAPNVLYGPGSRAGSITLTPTYQKGIFFVRGELSHVAATHVAAGSALGPNGLNQTQNRALVEGGVLF